MSSEDDLRALSDDELQDILLHMDRETYVERYRAVRGEYVRRHGATIQGQPIDDYFDQARVNRPFAERAALGKFFLLLLLAWSILMLVVKGILALSCSASH